MWFLHGLVGNTSHIYLDDIIVFGTTFEDLSSRTWLQSFNDYERLT